MKKLEVSFQRNADSWLRFHPRTLLLTGDQGSTRFEGQPAIEYLERETEGKRVLVNIHGYNSNREGALKSYRIIEDRVCLWGEYDVALRVTWPAHTAPGFWFALGAADESGKRLGELLARINPASVDIQAHSLGNRVCLVAMRHIYTRLAILSAPAVDDETLGIGERYYTSTQACDKMLVCHSEADKVLGKAFRRMGSIFTNFLWWGDSAWGDSALGYSGPQYPLKVRENVLTLEGTKDKVDHSGWRAYQPLYDRWKELLNG